MKSIQWQLFVIMILFIFFLSFERLTFAEDQIEKGSIIETKKTVKLRESPPSKEFLFFVSQPGETLSTAAKGEEIKVKEVKEIDVPFGKDIWVKGEMKNGSTGWIYYGKENNPVNFNSLKKKE